MIDVWLRSMLNGDVIDGASCIHVMVGGWRAVCSPVL
jgi:hypothetical protein